MNKSKLLININKLEEIAEYNTKKRLDDYLEEQQDIIDDE